MSSIEEKVEDISKKQLENLNIKYFLKTESINDEIEKALKTAESKDGGKGGNRPDLKLFIETSKGRKIPIMVEVKGTKGKLIKLNKKNEIDNRSDDGETNYSNIKTYAVNGAVHYTEAVLTLTQSYNEAIAIGINGYNDGDNIEYGVYYVSKDNFLIPKSIGDYDDLSFLAKNNLNKLIEKIDNLNLTNEEKENKTKDFENQIENKLKNLNQSMQDDLSISVGLRVTLVVGLIMAGLGVDNKVYPLEITDLKGQSGENNNDGAIVLSKITDFLEEKNIPSEKKRYVIDDLKRVFIYSKVDEAYNGESKIKKVYRVIKYDILPIFNSAKHLDFTGKLFNVLNRWVDIPDNERNDVVLTPRYVCDLMAKLCNVNKDSYVWDYTLGTAGFLIAAMKIMINDAENTIKSEDKLNNKIKEIKYRQLLGIEKRPDIYILAVLNMFLMGDGSSHILNEDSLEFDGKYEVESRKNSRGEEEIIKEDFPANVFLLNPPYSAKGKGLIFVEKALNKMKTGRAAILIQENAGSSQGAGYSKDILKNNTLIASIHMNNNLFCGKSAVQTAIYVFDVGIPHRKDSLVKFIDFSNDGYDRKDRKKSSQDVNLKDIDDAKGRYKEIADIVLNRKKDTNYYKDLVVEDTITLEGNDWTYQQHKKENTIPIEKDFEKTVADFMSYKISTLLKNGEDDDVNF